MKGVFELLLAELTPFVNDWGWGLPLDIRVDAFIGGGIAVPAAGLCRPSLVPFNWMELSAGDCPWLASALRLLGTWEAEVPLSLKGFPRAGVAAEPNVL